MGLDSRLISSRPSEFRQPCSKQRASDSRGGNRESSRDTLWREKRNKKSFLFCLWRIIVPFYSVHKNLMSESVFLLVRPRGDGGVLQRSDGFGRNQRFEVKLQGDGIHHCTIRGLPLCLWMATSFQKDCCLCHHHHHHHHHTGSLRKGWNQHMVK